MGQLDDKIALVTGGTSGIGLAAAKALAAEGAHVFVTGRRQETLDAAVASIGEAATGTATNSTGNGADATGTGTKATGNGAAASGLQSVAPGRANVTGGGAAVSGLQAAAPGRRAKVTGIRADVADLADLDRVAAMIAERGRGLDVLFANAGGGEFAALGGITWEHFADTFHTNVGGTLFTVQKVLPLLNRGASVILTSSNIDVKGAASFSVHAASKAALRSFARSWAAELTGREIRVNSIAPGPIETPGLSGLAPDPAAAAQLLEGLASGVPMNRLGRPEEIADAVVFLASNRSSFMTGAELYVDGGASQV